MTTFALKESMLDVHASCVVVVVDVHTTLWSLRQQFGTQEFLKLEDVSSLVSVYCNTISLMHRKNKVYVIFHNAGKLLDLMFIDAKKTSTDSIFISIFAFYILCITSQRALVLSTHLSLAMHLRSPTRLSQTLYKKPSI